MLNLSLIHVILPLRHRKLLLLDSNCWRKSGMHDISSYCYCDIEDKTNLKSLSHIIFYQYLGYPIRHTFFDTNYNAMISIICFCWLQDHWTIFNPGQIELLFRVNAIKVCTPYVIKCTLWWRMQSMRLNQYLPVKLLKISNRKNSSELCYKHSKVQLISW